jgi:methylated-DNA-[protein]-cysteine S-methyltransferase
MTQHDSGDSAAAEALGTTSDDHYARRLLAMRDRLADEAERRGLLDVAFDTIATPIGSLLLATTTVGLVRVAFDVENHDHVLHQLAATVSPRVLASPARLAPAARQIREYFAGTRRAFDLPLDLQLTKGFRRSVIDHLRRIEYGHTQSYAQVAAAAGSPNAVRAAGSACATNPLPVVVPCHRVVRTDGTIGKYLGGTDAKRALLALEAA